MHLKNLDVPVGAEAARRLFDELPEQIDSERRIGRVNDRDRLRGLFYLGVMLGLQAGGADEDRNICGNGPAQARFEGGRSGKVDQHVGMVLIDGERRIVGDSLRYRFSHPPVRRDEADPDRLFSGAHAAVSWRKLERRAIARRSVNHQGRKTSCWSSMSAVMW